MISRFIQVLLLSLAFAAVSYGANAASVVISVKRDAAVIAEIVYLKDIADISGEAETRDRIAQLSLGYSPQTGSVRQIPARKIRLIIAASGIPASKYQLNSPDFVNVTRSGQAVERTEIQTAIETAIMGLFSENEILVEIVRLDFEDPPEVPLGKLEIIPVITNVRNLFEPFSLPVEVRVDSRLVGRLSARVELSALANVLVASENIPANTRIGREQLEAAKQRITRPLTEYLKPNEEIRGIRTSREIRRGDVVTKDTFVADIVIKTGDRVRIIGTSGRLQLSIIGVAQGGGRIGDRISVKNLQSGNLLQGTIVDEGIVSVFF